MAMVHDGLVGVNVNNKSNTHISLPESCLVFKTLYQFLAFSQSQMFDLCSFQQSLQSLQTVLTV